MNRKCVICTVVELTADDEGVGFCFQPENGNFGDGLSFRVFALLLHFFLLLLRFLVLGAVFHSLNLATWRRL